MPIVLVLVYSDMYALRIAIICLISALAAITATLAVIGTLYGLEHYRGDEPQNFYWAFGFFLASCTLIGLAAIL